MRLLAVSPICPEALETLGELHDLVCAFDAEEQEIRSLIRDREALIFRSGVKITREILESAPALKLIVRAGSGTDNVDLDFVTKRGVAFLRIPEPGAQAVAEMSFALMLALARNLLNADCLTRRGRWAKHELTGYSLIGKVLGIVGSGNIGSRVGQLGAAWGMRPIGCVERQTPMAVARLRASGIRLAHYDEVIATADFISVHVPLKDSTRNLIDASVLARMKRGAFLINLARGGVLDEQALYRELVRGDGLAGAALDVHQEEGEGKISPLASLPNVILTPHIGAMTIDAQREIGRRVVEILNSVASPRVETEQSERPVLCTTSQPFVEKPVGHALSTAPVLE